MCTYQQLYFHDRIGYVLRCPECRTLQIAFGNLSLTIAQDILCDLRRLLEVIFWENSEISGGSIKQIRVPMPFSGISLLLNKRELIELMEMLDAADTELQSRQLIEMFESGSR